MPLGTVETSGPGSALRLSVAESHDGFDSKSAAFAGSESDPIHRGRGSFLRPFSFGDYQHPLLRRRPREFLRSIQDLAETDVRNGRYSERVLVKLRDIYNVDAIMFTSLKDMRPYWPQRFSASMQLVSTSTGETVWSIDGVWDGRDQNVSKMAQLSFRNSTAGKMSGDPELVLQSPEYMGKFVACQMASSLQESWPPFEYAPDPSKVVLTSHEQSSQEDSASEDDADAGGETIDTPMPSSDQADADPELPQPPPAN